MAKLRFRFGEADRAVYGEDWYELDIDKLADLDSGVLEEWEDQTGMAVMGDFTELLEQNRLRALRAALYLARRLAGCDDDWVSFKPNLFRLEIDEDAAKEGGPGNSPNRAERRAAARTRGGRSGTSSQSTTSP